MNESENSYCETTETSVCRGSLGFVGTMGGHRTPMTVTDSGTPEENETKTHTQE